MKEKELFRFPLKQHIGAASAPVVKAGDAVRRGQRIASKPEGALGANLFTSVSGVVASVTDSEIAVLADEDQPKDYVELTASDPLALIEESGLVGLGGAGFPTYAKLTSPDIRGGTVIINAAECEPILGHNIRRIEEDPRPLLRGLDILLEVTGAKEGVVAVKEIHAEAVRKLQAAVTNSRVRLHLLENIYPMGEERAVVREVLGQLLSVDSLPSKAGAVVVNAETAMRVREAVDLKKPMIDKDLTVAGKLKGNRDLIHIFEDVPTGRAVRTLFDEAGGLAEEYGELMMGGPFTGKRTAPDAPVVKTTGGLIATECFMKGPAKIGLLVCACGADEERMRQIAASMGSEVVGVEFCKQAALVKNTRKCENPGKCPGQVQKVMALKKAGAQAVLIGNCTDCSNTVMSCAPKLGLPVYHSTDAALRAVNHPLVRRIKA